MGAVRTRGWAPRSWRSSVGMAVTLLARISTRLLSLVALWWIVTEGRPGSWGVGVPVVLLATLLATAASAGRRWRLRPTALARFAAHFLVGSVRGGIDVALRVLSPRLRLSPGFLTHRLTLPEGAPRLLLVDVLSLMPGTLTVDLVEDVLHLHALNAGPHVTHEIAELERLVGALFAVPGPAAGEGRP